MRDFLHLTKQEYDDNHLGHTLASSGHIKDLCGGRVQDLDILRLEWSGFLLDNLNESRIHHQCFGEDNHN
ncbi:unnamed protein product, partial [Ectocarpus sp. 12 AP-2014]